ncbi:hypothetical protein [Actinocorallia libanotica]|uniref:Uncharacterized protein n=1 Tax=Actinocorallia libanotica TaxID=46162 RepID=A0ABP4BZ14_9ACTN
MDLESLLRLQRDEPPVEEFLASTGGALVHRDTDPSGLYWAVLQPTDQARRPFIAKIGWSIYPHRPPSLLFATEVGGPTADLRAWPSAGGYRAPNDVCKPFTAEGQALHPEWATGPSAWRSTGNPFLYVIETVHGDIDRSCGRRAA